MRFSLPPVHPEKSRKIGESMIGSGQNIEGEGVRAEVDGRWKARD